MYPIINTNIDIKFIFNKTISEVFKMLFLLKYLNWNLFIDNFNKVKKQNSCDIIYEILNK